MTDIPNPYAPPKAAVVEEATANDVYFTVGTAKLSLMVVATLGFYALYWFYRNWNVIRTRDRLRISPFWRAFFGVLWTFSLGRQFNEDATERNIGIRLPAVALGVLYLLLQLLGRAPQPYSLLTFLSFMPLVPFDRAARRLNGNGSLSEPTYGRFSAWNVAGLVVGTALVILIAIGSFIPESG
jgi:hypothetical protein